MTIQGGSRPKGPRFPSRPIDGLSRTDAPAQSADVASPEKAPPNDGFEDTHAKGLSGRPSTFTPLERPDDLLTQGAERPSGLRNMTALLEQTHDRLIDEICALKAQLADSIQTLQTSGFAPEALARARQELDEPRARLGKLRRRLAGLRRRLHMAHVQAGRAVEPQLKARLGSMIDEVARMEPGLARSLAALELAAEQHPRTADGASMDIARLDVSGTRERDALGTALAHAAPGSAVALHIASLLGREVAAPLSGEPVPVGNLGELAAFSAMQVGSARARAS